MNAPLNKPADYTRHEFGPDDDAAGADDKNADCSRRAAKAANPAKVADEPQPLFREPAAGGIYPVDALGNALADAARAIDDMVQCAMGTAAGSVLAAASLACQPLANIVLPIGDGDARPLSLYLVTVAASGERKTTADKLAMRLVKELEEELLSEQSRQIADWKADLAAWEAAKKKALQNAKGDHAAGRTALQAIGPEPERPMDPILTTGEPTMAGLHLLFRTGRPSLGLMSDEGGSMLGGWGLSEEQRLNTAAGLNSLWDGSTLKRVRVADGATSLPGRRLALHLMVQPVAAARLFGNDELQGVGLLARVLTTAPVELAGMRFYRPDQPASRAALALYHRQLAAILRMPAQTAIGDPRHLTPRRMEMDAGAIAAFRAYADICEAKLGKGREWAAIKPFGSKAAEHAARMAAVIGLFHDPDMRTLDAAMFERGRLLADFYAGEALRLHGAAVIDAPLYEADALRRWLADTGESVVALATIYQRGPAGLRTAAKAREACQTLQEHGWLRKLEAGADIDGARHREAWEVLRHAEL